MTLAERENIVRESQCFFTCLMQGHPVRKCKAFIKCVICGKRHVVLMCESLAAKNRESRQKSESSEINMSNITYGPKVFLQTMKLKLISDRKEIVVREVLDSGSQRTYILKNLAKKMEYVPLRKETLIHSLFGGHKSDRIRLRNPENNLTCNMEALDQASICDTITPVSFGPWLKELDEMNIKLSDVGNESQPVQILLGADVIGKFMTGKRRVFASGLVAIETLLGWTLTGKAPEYDIPSSNAMLVTSLLVKEMDISELWRFRFFRNKTSFRTKI
ncbi:uncharacterized protein [Parasteatoda tepidariorum]|uniref:uncharacterized protein n=1 Tax=Parasteatoda tepidariorum TaxID=114398 RepID=UPI0039BD6244